MVTVVTVYFQNGAVPSFSRCYTREWVEKLYRGVKRHYPYGFRFVCLTDQPYLFDELIETRLLGHTSWPTVMQQAFAVEAERLVVMGLDTVITGDLMNLFAYEGSLAVPRDPYGRDRACSGVVLCPTRPDIAEVVAGSDMAALDLFPHDWLDDLYPGQVVSYKGRVRDHGLGDARIVYFHGVPKPHELHDAWIEEHWHAL